jgi:uncharacterized protein (TIGR03086 family)
VAEARAASVLRVGDWSIDELLTHLVMVNTMCARSLAGFGPETLPPAEEVVGSDAFQAFQRTTTVFIDAFVAAADKSVICPTPVGPHPAFVVQTQGSMEHLVHACDLAQAISSTTRPTDDIVADAATRVLRDTALYDTFRSMGMYATAVDPGPDSSSLERLLGYLGRPA